MTRLTQSIITKYEKARIIGVRASQLSNNSLPLVDTEGIDDVLKIAEMEYHKKVIPFKIRRWLPNGEYEDWKLSELDDF